MGQSNVDPGPLETVQHEPAGQFPGPDIGLMDDGKGIADPACSDRTHTEKQQSRPTGFPARPVVPVFPGEEVAPRQRPVARLGRSAIMVEGMGLK